MFVICLLRISHIIEPFQLQSEIFSLQWDIFIFILNALNQNYYFKNRYYRALKSYKFSSQLYNFMLMQLTDLWKSVSNHQINRRRSSTRPSCQKSKSRSKTTINSNSGISIASRERSKIVVLSKHMNHKFYIL